MDEGYTNKLQKDSEKFSMKRGAMGLFVLRVAFAFLSATSMLSFVATLAYVKSSNANATYTAGLSAIINAVAAWHYKELINVRTEGYTNIDSELRMDSLRFVIKSNIYTPRPCHKTSQPYTDTAIGSSQCRSWYSKCTHLSSTLSET
jgi:CRISPR/Cas system CSM-associated protein Csm4 (group 5 of RAMP superfamily)